MSSASSSCTQGYDAVFTSEVPDDLTCVICHLVLRDPVQVINCGHCYCSVCLDQLVEHSNRSNTPLLCPLDRELIEANKVFKDKRMMRTVMNLNVKCGANEFGCEWSGGLSDLEAHESKCDYVAKQNSFQNSKYTDHDVKELFQKMNKMEDDLISKDKEIASLKFTIKEIKYNYEGVVKQLRDSIAYLKDEVDVMKEKYENNARKNSNEFEKLRKKDVNLETEIKDVENRLTETINKSSVLSDQSPVPLNQSQSSVTHNSKPKVERDTQSKIVATINPIVFFDITDYGESLGRIEMTLRSDVVPKTAENFRVLCTGEEGFGYKGSNFLSIRPGWFCRGGDVKDHNGSGGKSMYDKTVPNENFLLKNTGPGVLSMANSGGNTHGSQFLLWTAEKEKMSRYDGRTVVFGNVTKGMDVVKRIESSGSGRASKEIVIADCGQFN